MLNIRDRHLSSCNVESYLIDIRCKPNSKGSVTRASPQLTSSSWYHPSPTQPTRRERVHIGLLYILEIARSWHDYLTLVVLARRGGGGGGGRGH